MCLAVEYRKLSVAKEEKLNEHFELSAPVQKGDNAWINKWATNGLGLMNEALKHSLEA